MIKTLDNFKIVTKAGVTYDMADDFSVLVRSFTISSPRPEIQTEKIENAHGVVRLGKTWGQRSLKAVCSFFAVDAQDTALLRNEIFRLLMSEDEFYIVVDAEPGKRWLVEVASEWDPSKVGSYGEFTIDFVSHSAFSESINKTTEPFTFEDYPWQIGQGLIEADDLVYTHSTATFSIYNAGDVKVDPRRVPLTIKYTGASTNLQIKNLTTLDTWTYTGTTTEAETLEINGTRSLKNGVVNVFADTNRKLITLAPGWNNFELVGASGTFETSFDFRFYYL